jgi:translocation protein SEC63
VQEKTKERPFQAPYCLKARTLLHAHLNRLNTLSDDLVKGKQDHCSRTLLNLYRLDKRYVVQRAPYLINEMVNIAAQLVAMGHAGRCQFISLPRETHLLSSVSFDFFIAVKNPPRLDTIENTMKLSSMIVQALWNTKSPLLQLPHITDSHLRFFETKKVTF